VSGLRSALEEMELKDPASMPDGELMEDFEEIERACERLQARRLALLAHIDRRRTWALDGHLSTASWIVDRFGTSWSVATERVKMAKALENMPQTKKALDAGEISSCSFRILASASAAHPEAFIGSEEILVQAAHRHSVRGLRRAVAYWRELADADQGVDGSERAWNERHLHVSPTLHGMVRVDGDLDPETGETLITALRAVMDAERRSGDGGDARTPPQRRADALLEICRQWLDRLDRPDVAGERPHLTVTMDLNALEGRIGLSGFDHTGPIHPETARRIACDASVSRVITRGSSEPLDVGRRTPVVPSGLRRAVVVRDGTCRFPGCDRPHRWCDAHHVIHWADGGHTALQNLVLLCRRHHRIVHIGPIRLEMADRRPVFRREDGSILEDRGPP
jgi:Domain of unknown function (DUF222)/HNH endonuclease